MTNKKTQSPALPNEHESRAGMRNHSGRVLRPDGAATQDKILSAAARSFSEYGYRASTLRSIARDSEVDLATLKYHFGTKASLYAEVYAREQDSFRRRLVPVLAGALTIEDATTLRELIDTLAGTVLDYMRDHAAFPRMLLYRALESSIEPAGAERELQSAAIYELAAAFAPLIERGLVRQSDSTNMATFLVMGVPIWYLTLQAKGWFDRSSPEAERSAERGRRFLRELLERYLLFDNAQSPELRGAKGPDES